MEAAAGDVVATPIGIQAIDADDPFPLPVAARRERRGNRQPRFRLGRRCHGILQVKDERIGRDGSGLLQGPGIGAGHVEDGAAGTVTLGHGKSRVYGGAVSNSRARS